MPVFFRLAALFGFAAALFLWPLPGNARDTSVFADPYPGSVLSPQPYYPSFCSVLQPGPCQPEINYPFGQNLQLTIRSRAPAQPQKVAALPPAEQKDEEATKERRLNTIDDMFAALRACWEPPAKRDSRPGTQIAVRLSFKRNGEPVGPPRVTYVSAGTSAAVRKTYLEAVTASLKRCTPLAFSRGLGGALAGRPIAIRFVDDRPE
jgi:hypothetical protein